MVNSKDCCGCKACSNICPKNAITYRVNDQGTFEPIVDLSLCVRCGLCEKTCPRMNSNIPNNRPISAYAAYNSNIRERITGSSGGIMSEIAAHIINQGGYITGVYLDSKFHANYYLTNDLQLVKKFKKILICK